MLLNFKWQKSEQLPKEKKKKHNSAVRRDASLALPSQGRHGPTCPQPLHLPCATCASGMAYKELSQEEYLGAGLAQGGQQQHAQQEGSQIVGGHVQLKTIHASCVALTCTAADILYRIEGCSYQAAAQAKFLCQQHLPASCQQGQNATCQCVVLRSTKCCDSALRGEQESCRQSLHVPRTAKLPRTGTGASFSGTAGSFTSEAQQS